MAKDPSEIKNPSCGVALTGPRGNPVRVASATTHVVGFLHKKYEK